MDKTYFRFFDWDTAFDLVNMIDDGSKDNTSEIVAAYGGRVKYIF